LGVLYRLRGLVRRPGFFSTFALEGIEPGSVVAQRLASCIGDLRKAQSLPAPGDLEVIVPPTSTGWMRRVAGTDLWLYYGVSSNGDVVLWAVKSYWRR